MTTPPGHSSVSPARRPTPSPPTYPSAHHRPVRQRAHVVAAHTWWRQPNERYVVADCPDMVNAAPKGCDRCGTTLTGRRTRWCSKKCRQWFVDNHRYSNARRAARRRAKWRCTLCGSSERIEVNHIVPCLGQHNLIGCHHHQTNLEVLCHDCHVERTRAQRAAGAFSKRTSQQPAS